jgi:hypothetical protein
VSGFCECSQSESSHHSDFLLPMCDTVDKVTQVGKDCATYHDGDLLDDMDTNVPRLP